MTIVEIISVGFLAITVVGLIFFMAGVLYASRFDNEQHGYDTDMRIYIPNRDRCRSSNQRTYKWLEEVNSDGAANRLKGEQNEICDKSDT